MKNRKALLSLVILFSFICGESRASLVDFNELVGYRVLKVDHVAETLESSSGDKYIKLRSGITFKVQFLLLPPLNLTEVVIFSREPSEAIIRKYKDKLPVAQLYSYKLLINDNLYNATPR